MLFIYGLMIVTAIGVIVAVCNYGETLFARSDSGIARISGVTVESSNTMLRLLVALAAVIITGQILAKLFAFFDQPPVIGEVIAGILLGPSILGQSFSSLILPPSIAPYLGVIAQTGIILYMFTVGLELNPGLIKERVYSAIATSHASIIAPFLLGSMLALFLYPKLSDNAVSFSSFALFIGVSMSITAFPVLARILTDRGMNRTELGAISLS
jgi:Kef-type K+ transport system membrane component KefB